MITGVNIVNNQLLSLSVEGKNGIIHLENLPQY